MEHTPSQVKNHYFRNNQEAHLERALAFKKAANLHCPSSVCLASICLRASYCGWLISLISIMYPDDKTYQEIGDDNSDTGESSISSNIEEDDLDCQQVVLHPDQAPGTSHYALQGFHCHRNRAVLILSLDAFCFQIPEINLRQWHHHCSNAKSHPASTNYPSLTVQHPPGHWCFPTSLVETRIFHNPRPLAIGIFPNTKTLLLR